MGVASSFIVNAGGRLLRDNGTALRSLEFMHWCWLLSNKLQTESYVPMFVRITNAGFYFLKPKLRKADVGSCSSDWSSNWSIFQSFPLQLFCSPSRPSLLLFGFFCSADLELGPAIMFSKSTCPSRHNNFLLSCFGKLGFGCWRRATIAANGLHCRSLGHCCWSSLEHS